MIEEEDIEYRTVADVLRDVPLWQRRLNTWSGRIKGDAAPVTFYFGTSRHGTVYLKPSYPVGMLQCMVMLDDRYIGSVSGPAAAVLDVASGRFDDALGFSAREEHISDDIRHWSATPMGDA